MAAKGREIAEKAAAASEPFTQAERIEVEATTVSGLRQDELEQLTDQFALLGFVRVWDLRFAFAWARNDEFICATMVNPELKCFAEIIATQKTLDEKRLALLGGDILAELPMANQITSQGTWVWLGDYPEQAARRVEGRKLRPLSELAPTYRVPQEDSIEQMTMENENAAKDKDGGEDSQDSNGRPV